MTHGNFCTQCGGSVAADQRFCPACGATLEALDPAAIGAASDSSPGAAPIDHSYDFASMMPTPHPVVDNGVFRRAYKGLFAVVGLGAVVLVGLLYFTTPDDVRMADARRALDAAVEAQEDVDRRLGSMTAEPASITRAAESAQDLELALDAAELAFLRAKDAGSDADAASAKAHLAAVRTHQAYAAEIASLDGPASLTPMAGAALTRHAVESTEAWTKAAAARRRAGVSAPRFPIDIETAGVVTRLATDAG